MRKFILLSALMLATTMFAKRIQVVDTDNMPIAAVAVTDEKGALVGRTDNDGWLNDSKGLKKLFFSHMAFKPTKVETDTLSLDRVVMADADYNLGEVTVKPKELIYVQTYYRVSYVNNEGPIYFRAGVVDNTFEVATKKISKKARSISRAENGIIKFAINALAGRVLDNWAKIDTLNYYDRILKNAQKGHLMISEPENGRRIISDSICVLGYIDDDLEEHRRTVVFNRDKYLQHRDSIEEAARIEKLKREGKPIKEKKKKDKEVKDNDDTYYEVIRIDDEGRSRISDVIMKQLMAKGHARRTDTDYIILLEVFTTGCDYIDKKDFKQTRKDNEVEMDILELRQFEKIHNIPPLSPNLKEQIDKLFEKDIAKAKK